MRGSAPPQHRRPDRHNVTLMNPQQYFFGCASVPISASIDLNRVLQLNTFGVRSPSRPMFNNEYDLMNQKLFDATFVRFGTSSLSFGMCHSLARSCAVSSSSKLQPKATDLAADINP